MKDKKNGMLSDILDYLIYFGAMGGSSLAADSTIKESFGTNIKDTLTELGGFFNEENPNSAGTALGVLTSVATLLGGTTAIGDIPDYTGTIDSNGNINIRKNKDVYSNIRLEYQADRIYEKKHDIDMPLVLTADTEEKLAHLKELLNGKNKDLIIERLKLLEDVLSEIALEDHHNSRRRKFNNE